MLQVFWFESKRLIGEGKTYLKTREVSLPLIEKRYFLNFECEGWEKERVAGLSLVVTFLYVKMSARICGRFNSARR